MRLLLPSLILVLYIMASLVWPLPLRPLLKACVGLGLLIISLKYYIYIKIGGSFIAPDFPAWLLLVMEFCYSTLIILAFVLVVKDLFAMLLWLSRLMGSGYQMPFTPVVRGAGLLSVALVLSLYASWQAVKVPEVRTVEVTLPRLPAELDGFSVVQLSDLHIGLLLKKKWLQKVVARTNSLNADLVVLTGDMIDGPPEDLRDDIAPLQDLKANHGIYGITGNHEYYFNSHRWQPVFEELGVNMLQNEFRTISRGYKNLVVIGVPDPMSMRYGVPQVQLDTLENSLPEGVRLLLKHRPSGPVEGFRTDLQLSGHTHGGHLFFLKWLIGSYNGNLVGGLFDFDAMKLYVSPGTGVWAGFSSRLGVPSEITRIVMRSPVAADNSLSLN